MGFKESSIQILEGEEARDCVYWTWVTADNYTLIYDALNRITKCIQFQDPKEEKMEISDAEIVDSCENESGEKEEIEKSEIECDEFFDSVREGNDFKFFQKYSYWSPAQLEVEIANNVWFAAELSDDTQMRELLRVKCPSSKGKIGKRKKEMKESGNVDSKKNFNKWMWQSMVKELGNGFVSLADSSELNNEQTKEFYAFMEEFHSSWIPDVDAEEPYYSDEEEEDTTVW